MLELLELVRALRDRVDRLEGVIRDAERRAYRRGYRDGARDTKEER